jgi:hypothetical protein
MSRAKERQEKRNAAIYAAYCSDPSTTYRSLGEQFGISYERVRQVVAQMDLDAAVASRSVIRAAVDRTRLFEDFAHRAADARPCTMCGYWVLRGSGRRTCSPACARAFATSSVRFAVDEREWERHRGRMARYWLRKGTPIQRRHARRVLAGVASRRGRWHIPGSSASTTIKRMCPDKLSPVPRSRERGEATSN